MTRSFRGKPEEPGEELVGGRARSAAYIRRCPEEEEEEEEESAARRRAVAAAAWK